MIDNIEKTMYELMGRSDEYEKMIQERKQKQREEVIKTMADPTKALCLLNFPIENLECLFKGKTDEEIGEMWKCIHEAVSILTAKEAEEREQAEAEKTQEDCICKLFNMTEEEEPFDHIVQKNPTKFYTDKGRQISFFDLFGDDDEEEEVDSLYHDASEDELRAMGAFDNLDDRDDDEDENDDTELGHIICIFRSRSR